MKLNKTIVRYAVKSFAGAALATAAAFPVTGLAQSAADYPSKTVRLIVPFAPGGATDTLARLAGASMSTRFKQPVVVENRPGGNTLIGLEATAKSPPDGYTLTVTSSNVATEQVVNKEWPLRVERDLATISVFAGGGYAVTVSSATGVKSLKELIDYVKANPGKVNQAEAGAISTDMAILKQRIGLPAVESILYKGGPMSVQAILSGEVQIYGAAVLDVASLHKAGRLRVIAYTERERHPLIPDVPTVAESNVGVNDFEAGFFFALMGPVGIPADILSRLNAAAVGMVREPEFLEKTNQFGMRVYPIGIVESRNRIASVIKATEAAQAAGIKLR